MLCLTYDMHVYIQYVIELIAYQALEMPVYDVFVLCMRTHEWPTKPKVHGPKGKTRRRIARSKYGKMLINIE